ncbi:MAG: hypothetical protein NTY53_24290 [Kiritimatiellaeota bacterium]|nr:hypothetical protein [Kiritimatiellota bacterium]
MSSKNLETGQFDFSDKVQQQGDVKTFGGSVPPEALAAGRCVVEFTDHQTQSTFPDISKFRDGDAIVSTTKQLRWDTSGQGFFTVNTPGTKAVVGFAAGRPQKLEDVTIELQCPYASVFLTALDKGTTLANAKSALVNVVARNCNTGFSYFAMDSKTIDNGKAPILLEPVKAAITIAGRTVIAVHVLDQSGRRTGKTLTINAGRFELDGTRDQTLYYEVELR